MGKRNLKNLDNLGSWSKYKKLPNQSFSSAFSKKISPRANSPKPTSLSPANLPEVFQSPSNPSPTPEENDDYNMIEEVPRPMENEEEMEDSGYSLR